MKFGKYIQTQQFPEWASYYVNYKGLKKIINNLGHEEVPVSSDVLLQNTLGGGADARSRLLQSQKAAFFFKLERELEKVNIFYLQKESDLKVRLRTLIDKKKILQSRTSYSLSSLASLREAFAQFQHDLNKLQQFVEINATGFRKILKKWDKQSKSSTKELYLSRQVEVQPCFNRDIIAELADSAATNLLELENMSEGLPLQSPAIERSSMQTGESYAAADDLEAELFTVLQSGRIIEAQEILDRRLVKPTSEERDSISRVFWRACSEVLTEFLLPLINTGFVNFNYADDISDRTCLHEAAINGRSDILAMCVKNGSDLHSNDVYGRKALHYASMYGYDECVTYLLDSGAEISPLDHDGFNPLIYAVINGHTKCVELFLERGAEIEPRPTNNGHIPLLLACQYGHKDIATLLLSKGAKIIPNSEGLYPLHLTSREGHVMLSKLLVENGAQLDTTDTFHGWTPIFYATSEGHEECVRILLDAGCKVNVRDDSGATPIFYGAIEGHAKCVKMLLEAGVRTDIAVEPMEPVVPSVPVPHDSGDENDDIDAIPSLELPPPIIPFRIYGHNYLDKKYQIHMTLGHLSTKSSRPPVRLYGNSRLSSLKLVISPKPDTGIIPHSVILPLGDKRESFTFQVDSLNNFSVDFEIFPTFGSKVIGKAVSLPSVFNNEHGYRILNKHYSGGKVICPFLDTHLKVVGELAFEFLVIKPFQEVKLEIGGRIETYWKSTSAAKPSPATSDSLLGDVNNPNLSLITASSLADEYIQLVVQVTRDMVPVVYPNWYLPVEGFDLCVSNVSYKQFKSIAEKLNQTADMMDWNGSTSSSDLVKKVTHSFMSLEEVFKTLPSSIGLGIDIKYPTSTEMNIFKLGDVTDINDFVDTVLQVVYRHANTYKHNETPLPVDKTQRNIIFTSFNPSICRVVNWKQPNYAVFFSTYCGFKSESLCLRRKRKETEQVSLIESEYYDEEYEEDARRLSIKEAVKFSRRNNLLGIMCEATPLVQVPSLIQSIKESGLILASFGPLNDDPKNVQLQEAYGVDAIVSNGTVRYSKAQNMEFM
ncbi:phosphate system positive regulatory protein pho81 [Basidiobolus ranarum]|uniref:Phosphate system positive regulatory protein pho81 n=1 Tax=Basidiobolus ranarum TaxID=34480 RepID=A0ABR2WHX5_9FUNG